MRTLAILATTIFAGLAILAGTADAANRQTPRPAPQAAAQPAAQSAPSARTTWIVVCYDQRAQYTQVLNGQGFFHVANDDHQTYDTQRLVQSHYDGNLLCAIPDPRAPHANSDVAEVCIDRSAQTLSVLPQSETATKRVIPRNTSPFCQAHVDVMQQ
jgi:hypothetical protein